MRLCFGEVFLKLMISNDYINLENTTKVTAAKLEVCAQ